MSLKSLLGVLAEVQGDRLRRSLRRILIQAALCTLAVALIAVALFAGFVAVFLLLSQTYGPAVAAGITAAGTLAVAALVFVSAAIFPRPRPKRGKPRMEMDETLDTMETVLSVWASKQPGALVLVAFAAGVAVGFSPRLRRALDALLK